MEDDNCKEKRVEEVAVPSPPTVLLLGSQGNLQPLSSSSAAADNETDISSPTTRRQGGLITMPFIIGNEAFEKVASYGLAPNMIMYLMKDYRMGVAKAANILFLWSAATNFMPLFGAFFSDSFLGRYLTITIASLFSFLGTILLWLTTMLPETKPPPCNSTTPTNCTNPTSAQLALLFSSFALMSIGAGGIRPCSLAFGADQVENRANPAKNKRILETFFGWYYASTALSVLVALTAIVYLQDRLGWRLGFGVPVILMFLSAVLFLVASPFYVKHKPTMSLLTGFAQVVVAAYKNRKLPFPASPHVGARCSYHRGKGSDFLTPTKKLRFLNKACVIMDPDNDVSPNGSATNPWRLCTVQQVEELKAVIKVIPIWSSGIMLSVNTSQSSFPLLQASSMDRHLTSGFQIPAASYSMFLVVTIIVWVVLYDRAILPLASKLWGKPVKLSTKLRMGVGLVVSCLSMVVAAIVENSRRRKAIEEGYLNNPSAVVNMSAMWLVPQYVLLGLAESLNAIGQIEFYYSEFPKSMSSIASCLFGVGMGVASLLSSVILSAANNLTSKDGKQGWINDNINQARYDCYYWLLAIMGAVNVVYFLLCSWAYGPCEDEMTKIENDGNGFMEEEEMGNGRHNLQGKEQELLIR